jgi:hypothetical protein
MSTEDELEPASGLPRVFTPAQAAQVLRDIGLEDITECALRTRAYRKQIPFHLNGHRIIFTIEDLREIAQGTPCPPRPPTDLPDPPSTPAPLTPRRTAPRRTISTSKSESWRAKRPRHAS